MEQSPNRCGYTTDYLPEVEPSNVCCWRPVWKDTDRCIWHADVDEKPENELREARGEIWERLDQAMLRGVDLEGVSFERCGLFGADFSNSNLDGAIFSQAIVSEADFSDAQLRRADFSGTLSESALFKAGIIGKADFRNSIVTGADFSKSNLAHSNFDGAEGEATKFVETRLNGSTFVESFFPSGDFSNAEMMHVDLSKGSFPFGEFSGANLSFGKSDETRFVQSDFEEANFRGANLNGADLEETSLIEVDFSKANLSKTKFDDSVLRDAIVDEGTNFDDIDVYEIESDQEARQSGIITRIRERLKERNFAAAGGRSNRGSNSDNDKSLPFKLLDSLNRVTGRPSTNPTPHRQAVRSYQVRQRLLRRNSLPDKVSEAFIREQDARRKLALSERSYRSWLWLALKRAVMKYGESPRQVAKFSGFVIGLWSLLYLLTLGIAWTPPPNNRLVLAEVFTIGGQFPDFVVDLGFSLYYSVSTFTTLGYGDVHPVGEVSKFLAGVEALTGAVLIALYVSVYSRRVMR